MILSAIETAHHKTFIQWLCNQVTRVIDGGEPVEFKSLFRHWKDRNLSEVQSNLPKISVNSNSKFDAEVLHNHPEMVRLIFKDSLPKNVIINFPLSHKSDSLLICTGFLKYPFGHLFQTEINIDFKTNWNFFPVQTWFLLPV